MNNVRETETRKITMGAIGGVWGNILRSVSSEVCSKVGVLLPEVRGASIIILMGL